MLNINNQNGGKGWGRGNIFWRKIAISSIVTPIIPKGVFMPYLILAFLILFSVDSFAVQHRSAKARAEFKRMNPCPANGNTRGKCPGYVIDHIVPLCAGGADDPVNMQWQERMASYRKDADERRMCRGMR